MFFLLDDWVHDWATTLESVATTTRGRIYDPEKYDLTPKQGYIQEEIDRLSKRLKQAEDKEKEAKKYWRTKQDEIKEQIAELTKQLKD